MFQRSEHTVPMNRQGKTCKKLPMGFSGGVHTCLNLGPHVPSADLARAKYLGIESLQVPILTMRSYFPVPSEKTECRTEWVSARERRGGKMIGGRDGRERKGKKN